MISRVKMFIFAHVIQASSLFGIVPIVMPIIKLLCIVKGIKKNHNNGLWFK
jgi:hypothetical protein